MVRTSVEIDDQSRWLTLEEAEQLDKIFGRNEHPQSQSISDIVFGPGTNFIPRMYFGIDFGEESWTAEYSSWDSSEGDDRNE